jgi:hypothetical protein
MKIGDRVRVKKGVNTKFYREYAEGIVQDTNGWEVGVMFDVGEFLIVFPSLHARENWLVPDHQLDVIVHF